METEAPESDPLRDLFRSSMEQAAQNVKDLADMAESEGVRQACNFFILEAGAGLKRAKREETGTPTTQINIFLQQAAEAYKKQVIDV